MNLCSLFLLAASLLVFALPSCKKAEPVASGDPKRFIEQIDRLTIVSEALRIASAKTALDPQKEERAQKIAQLKTLLDEDAKKASEAFIQALKANPGSASSVKLPPIRFPKPSHHPYLPELTDVEIEQLRKTIGDLEQAFASHEQRAVFQIALDDCKKVLNAQPGTDLRRSF